MGRYDLTEQISVVIPRKVKLRVLISLSSLFGNITGVVVTIFSSDVIFLPFKSCIGFDDDDMVMEELNSVG